jgi:outer membrane protein assembly factor BamE
MKLHLIYLIGLQLILTSCTIHKIDIQQGNILDSDTAAQVKPGMSREQVQFLLGNPAIKHPFDHDRWDYPFSFKSGKNNTPVQRYHLTVFFSGDIVDHVDANIPADTKANP